MNYKIFCVGQPKTGTKSLAEIFIRLGKKVSSNPMIDSDYNLSLIHI